MTETKTLYRRVQSLRRMWLSHVRQDHVDGVCWRYDAAAHAANCEIAELFSQMVEGRLWAAADWHPLVKAIPVVHRAEIWEKTARQ